MFPVILIVGLVGLIIYSIVEYIRERDYHYIAYAITCVALLCILISYLTFISEITKISEMLEEMMQYINKEGVLK